MQLSRVTVCIPALQYPTVYTVRPPPGHYAFLSSSQPNSRLQPHCLLCGSRILSSSFSKCPPTSPTDIPSSFLSSCCLRKSSSSSTPLIPGPISVPATWALYTICSWGRLPHPVGREAPYPPGLELPNFWQCIFCTPASGCLPRPDVEFSQANSSTLFVPRTRSSQLKG